MLRPIRFKFAPHKALAAIHWMVDKKPGVDLHTILKACYFADKEHLNSYRRPVFGAAYRAMKFGPVPIEIYEMAKGEIIWLAELELKNFPWKIDGYCLLVNDNNRVNVNTEALSRSDMAAIERGFEISLSMSFNERTAATHGPDWQAAELGFIKYEDMIIESPSKDEIVSYLRDNSQHIRI